MLVAITVFAAIIGALLVVVTSLRRAPEAYEDDHGFHILRTRVRGSTIIRAAKEAKLHRSEALKRAEANS